MQIVIDINDEIYKEILNGKDGWSNYVHGLIRIGTPLTKGHGRLIDADDVKSYFSDREGDDFTVFHFYDAVESTPTIIEADKAES